MKELALSIAGTPVQLPQSITNINNNAGDFGGNIFGKIIQLFLLGIIITAFAYIIYGGIKWIISQGDPKKIDDARNTLLNAVIGLFIAAFAYFVVGTLSSFVGAPLLGK